MSPTEIIETLQCLGLQLQDPDGIHPDETEPDFILVGEGERGMAFSHVLYYDAEMVEEDDAYSKWVLEWARVTGKEDRVTDVASEVDFDGSQGGTYVWLPEECVAEFCELFPEAVRG